MLNKYIALAASLPLAFTAATAAADDAKTFIEGKPDKPHYVDTTVEEPVKPYEHVTVYDPVKPRGFPQSNQTACNETNETSGVKPVKPSQGPTPKFS